MSILEKELIHLYLEIFRSFLLVFYLWHMSRTGFRPPFKRVSHKAWETRKYMAHLYIFLLAAEIGYFDPQGLSLAIHIATVLAWVGFAALLPLCERNINRAIDRQELQAAQRQFQEYWRDINKRIDDYYREQFRIQKEMREQRWIDPEKMSDN